MTTYNVPAIRLIVQSGRQHNFMFQSIAELALVGELITRHAEQLAAIAVAAARPH